MASITAEFVHTSFNQEHVNISIIHDSSRPVQRIDRVWRVGEGEGEEEELVTCHC